MPAAPEPAATVILLRDTAASPELLMIERHARSDFLPDLYVFPGGRVEQEDHALGRRLSGIDADAAARALCDCDAELAAGFFVAAIRETFEEAGILLARELGGGGLVAAERAAELAQHRLAVQEGSVSFRELIERERLELAGDLLAVHAHWITPEMVPKRFDTYFFTAIAPPGQVARHDGVETTDHVWIRAADALAQMRRGERQIIFPTACNLETLEGFASASEALAASHARPVVPVLPRLAERSGARQMVIRTDAGYKTTEHPLPTAPR